MVDRSPNPELSEELELQEARDRVMGLVDDRLSNGDSMDFRMPVFEDSDFEKAVFDLIITPSGISRVTKWTPTTGGNRIPEVAMAVSNDFYQRYEEELTVALSQEAEAE